MKFLVDWEFIDDNGNVLIRRDGISTIGKTFTSAMAYFYQMRLKLTPDENRVISNARKVKSRISLK